jgi:hypothetical protein
MKVLTDLKGRMERAIARLEERAADPANGMLETKRLTAKASGVKLALGYVDETMRSPMGGVTVAVACSYCGEEVEITFEVGAVMPVAGRDVVHAYVPRLEGPHRCKSERAEGDRRMYEQGRLG